MTFTQNTKMILTAMVLSAAVAACSSDEPAAAHTAEAAPAKSSSAGMPKGRVAEGEKIALSTDNPNKQSCTECHGKNGDQPLDDVTPILGGQYADYLEYALKSYQDGKRDHAIMKTQADHLDDQQISDVAAYFASRPAKLTDLTNAK